jgi:hypothetical protein
MLSCALVRRLLTLCDHVLLCEAPAAPQPYKFFDRHVGMKGMQMINYRTTSVPDPSNPSRTMPVGCLVGIAKENDRIVGRMQLFSSEKSTTQTLDGHTCSFIRWGKSNTRRLFCYATRTPSESKVVPFVRVCARSDVS